MKIGKTIQVLTVLLCFAMAFAVFADIYVAQQEDIAFLSAAVNDLHRENKAVNDERDFCLGELKRVTDEREALKWELIELRREIIFKRTF